MSTLRHFLRDDDLTPAEQAESARAGGRAEEGPLVSGRSKGRAGWR